MRKPLFTFAVFAALNGLTNANEEIVFAERGGIQLVSIPQSSPRDGFVATKVVARSLDPNHDIVTFTNLNLLGDVHQRWLRVTATDRDGEILHPTPYVQSLPNIASLFPGRLTAEEQIRAQEGFVLDSHFLVTPDMIGGGAGACYCLSEANDETTTLLSDGQPELWPEQLSFPTGYGDIRTQSSVDAFFLRPQSQRPNVDLWYVVTEDQPHSEVFLTVGLLGSGFADAGVIGGAAFGYDTDEPIRVPFAFSESDPLVPEPSSGALIFSIFCMSFSFRRSLR